jgi:hypothetical protein
MCMDTWALLMKSEMRLQYFLVCVMVIKSCNWTEASPGYQFCFIICGHYFLLYQILVGFLYNRYTGELLTNLYPTQKNDAIFKVLFVCFWRVGPPPSPQWGRASSFTRFLDHIQRRTTVGRTPLNEWPARRWDLYLTTYNTHNTQTFMTPQGFKPTIAAGEQPQT